MNHSGEHFKVKGPLNVARSPQGQPVIVQAGSSELGRELAAQTAEVVFTAQTSLSTAQGVLCRSQRPPGEVRPLDRRAENHAGGLFVVGQSEAEAREKYESFQQWVEPEVGVALLGRMLGNFDLSGYPLDGGPIA